MKDLKVLFMGTPDFAVPILEGLIENCNVVGVVSQPDKKVGRHQELVYTPIKAVAVKHNIKCFQPEKIKLEFDEILKLDIDIIITCAYGQIIPKEILDFPRLGCINVHASLLPKLRGGAPIHKSIIEGHKETGITIMYMDIGMDTGDMISKKSTDILDTDNLESVHDRLSLMGKELLLETLPSIINGTNERIKQNNEEATYAFNIKREEEHIDFNKTKREVFNLIRGLSPVPGANFLLEDIEFKVYDAYIGDKIVNNKLPGEITNIYKDGIGVNTLDGEIVITEIKPFGKKKMDVKSYLNGLKDKENLIGKVLK